MKESFEMNKSEESAKDNCEFYSEVDDNVALKRIRYYIFDIDNDTYYGGFFFSPSKGIAKKVFVAKSDVK